MNSFHLTLSVIFSFTIFVVNGWTDEDLELFDLVESTDKKFYDILGVDQKASASDIRKAYRKLSQIYHPDRNKAADAEETFRKIAAVAEVLKNEEQRKKYDIILQTGLPDWREPVYYYRRVRNMGLFELVIFLFCLATVGQYLFLWSAYLEKKYEMDEIMSAKLKKKAKLQKKGKAAKTIAAEELEYSCDIVLPKPKWQDLFPVRLTSFFIHTIISSPFYLKTCFENLITFFRKREEESDEEEDSEDEEEIRIRPKKHTQHQAPYYPEFSDDFQTSNSSTVWSNGSSRNGVGNGIANGNGIKHQESSNATETDMKELKKAMKKFPQGTLQRWEKIATYLNCSVSQVVSMAKQLKSQEFAKNKLMLLEMQGISGILKEGESHTEDLPDTNGITHSTKSRFKSVPNGDTNGSLINGFENCNGHSLEKIWQQEEQRALELALQKFPKDTPSRWDRIADAVPSKTKEECIARYKELAQQIKKKKIKDN